MRFKVGDKIKWNTSHTIFTVSEISGPRFRVEGYHVWNYDAPGVALVVQYRVKPEKKPDVVKFMSVWTTNPGVYASKESPVRQEVGGELKLTFDGETGKLKAVQILGN